MSMRPVMTLVPSSMYALCWSAATRRIANANAPRLMRPITHGSTRTPQARLRSGVRRGRTLRAAWLTGSGCARHVDRVLPGPAELGEVAAFIAFACGGVGWWGFIGPADPGGGGRRVGVEGAARRELRGAAGGWRDNTRRRATADGHDWSIF